ncbi:hypothetical protein [Nocardia gipuzkoensis]
MPMQTELEYFALFECTALLHGWRYSLPSAAMRQVFTRGSEVTLIVTKPNRY